MTTLTKTLLLMIGLFLIPASLILSQEVFSETDIAIAEELILDETVAPEQLGLSEPTLLPDSPFYFLKNWQRSIKSFFTFDPVKKAELKLKYASEKLLEANKLAAQAKKTKIVEKAAENFQKEIDKIKEITETIKDKASENPKVAKFLDKFIKQQVLHQKILDRLEKQVPEEVAEKIRTIRENHLERFGQVMEKLETKENLKERLEKNLNEMEGNQFKDLKNIEILKRLEQKAPEAVKEKIKETKERLLDKFEEKLEEMPAQTQEKLKNYIENMQGKTEEKAKQQKEKIEEMLKQRQRKIEEFKVE